MRRDEIMLMAYVDGALNREGQRLIKRSLAADEELRSQQVRLQHATQLAKLSVAHLATQDIDTRTVGLILCGVKSRRRAIQPQVVTACMIALAAAGVLFAAVAQFSARTMNRDAQSINSVDREKGGSQS